MPDNTRTSTTHPLYVSWLPVPQGQLGLTLAPGKHQRGLYSGAVWRRDLGADLDRLRDEHHTDVLICLLEDHEMVRLRLPRYVEEATARGMEVIGFPIPDGDVPKDTRAVEDLLLEMDQRLASGKTVVVHCAGGLGRTGTIAGCYLRATGLGADEALQIVKNARGPRCPETRQQTEYVAAFSYRLATSAESQGLPTAEQRWLGAVLGAAIGDAMGHPTEFLDMARIRSKYGPQGVTGFELWWEDDGRRFAPYTDDTQMAEVVLRSLLDAVEASDDLDAAMERIGTGFVDWSHDPQGGHRAPGKACLAGCRAFEAGARWSEAGGARAGGCGSVMRAYPMGLVFATDETRAEHWAVAQSKLTHRDPIALAACAAMAVGMVRLYDGASVEDAVEAMIRAAERYSDKTADMMRQARTEALGGVGPEVTLDRLRAWAAHEAIAAAVYVLLRHPDDPRAGILEGANTPGDSDSIATLVGALVGVHLGVDAFPETWGRDVERADELAALARHGWAVRGNGERG